MEKFDLSQPTKNHFHLDADLRILFVIFISSCKKKHPFLRPHFSFSKDVTDPIQFHMKYTKCPLDDLASCDDHETAKVDHVCDHFSEQNALWSPLLKTIKPKLSCPIKKVISTNSAVLLWNLRLKNVKVILIVQGVYTVRNGTFDLSMMSRLPVDGNQLVRTLQRCDEN